MKRGAILLILLLAGCNVFDQRIREPAEPTPTPIPFSTATPGGKISVWMTSGTEEASLVTPQDTPEGVMVAPAATATAAAERILFATQTAAAPTPQPAFQPDNCPEARALSAPARPASFEQYPAAIGVYLSNGGSPTVLESILREWGALTEQGGIVQGDTDLTGDAIPEVLMTLFNPTLYNPAAILNSGQLLVFGCDEGGYRLLYNTPNNPGLALPVLHRVGDMNGNAVAEVVFDIQSCTTSYCTREGFILAWEPVVGIFQAINNEQILATNGRLGVADIDEDGILELTVSSNTPTSPTSGPTRGVVDTWDWDGQNYVFVASNPDEARYRIHRLHDADTELFAGNRRSAITGYFEARDDAELLPWSVPSEAELLRAFATYRIVTTYARNGDERSESTFNTLISENPPGTPGEVFAAMGQAFMDNFRGSGDATAACGAALGVAASRPEALSYLNSYGFANRSYILTDLCPF
jgi:hypothetical protein